MTGRFNEACASIAQETSEEHWPECQQGNETVSHLGFPLFTY